MPFILQAAEMRVIHREHGHAKRGGGRVAAKPHIASAEQRGNEKLVQTIEQKLKGG